MIYIGKTARSLEIRLQEHLRHAETYFERAVKKYGIDAFEVSVVEECNNEKELNEREIYWIEKFNCKYPNGYNLTDGGEGCTGFIHSAETRAKISETHRGREKAPCSEETRKKISVSNKGHSVTAETRAKISAARIGKKLTLEHRQKLSAVRKGKQAQSKNTTLQKHSRSVICVETNQIFDSIGEASRWAGVERSTLRCAINHENRTAGKYHWCSLDNDNNQAHIRQKRAVRCVETGVIFESLISAAKWADLNTSTISNACNNPNRTAGGYHWIDTVSSQ